MKRATICATVLGLVLAPAAMADILLANPGPANNGGSANWAIFFDLEAAGSSLFVTHMKTASTAAANSNFNVEVFTRVGTALGGGVGGGAGSSSAGWTSLGTVQATQGGTSSGISLLIDIPDILVPANSIVGVAVRFTVAGPRYFGTGTPPYSIYQDANLKLTTGDARSAPFTTTGSFFASRALVGELHYEFVPAPGAMALLGAAAFIGRRRRR